jgi:glycosyltransferase Alg8
LTGDALLCRKGASWLWQLAMSAALAGIAALLLWIVGGPRSWATHRVEVLFTLGGIALWRWSWFAVQNARAIIYRFWAFPRMRREIERAVAQHGPIPEVTVLGTTYHEKPWITEAVFGSVFRELSTVEGLTRRPKVVVVTGCDDDDRNIQQIFARCCEESRPANPAHWPPELVLARGDKGKRLALGTGMEEIARSGLSPDGVVIILDGDTMLGPGLMNKVLPVFRLTPAVSAVTTNEDGVVKGPAWFAEWTSLRFGLRHRSMCSISLSGKLLCLTGRFSVFRASVVCDPSFRAQVEQDTIHHWLWGSFEMLSGDDKSTWFWLAKKGHRMLYVPDAMVTTFEVISGSSLHRAMANVRRWSGNSVRHGWRAIMLGPNKLGFFLWWCLVDQRLTMLTILFGPTVAIFSLLTGRFEMAAAYLLWVLCSRVAHASIAWRQGRRFSAIYIPLQILSDWIISLTKLWVLFHPAKQNWLNRGKRTMNTTRGSAFYGLRTSFAHYLYGFSCVAVVIAVGLFVGFLPIFRDARLFLNSKPEARPAPSVSRPNASQNLRERLDAVRARHSVAKKSVNKDPISTQQNF